jgi:TolB protein
MSRAARVLSRSRMVLGTLALGLLVAGCGNPDLALSTETAVPQRGADPSGEILFVSEGNVKLWHDGDVDQLTEDVVAKSPTWSTAGDRFAYVKMFDGFSDLVLADRDGDELQQLTTHEPLDEPFSEDWAYNASWAFDPIWSPVKDEIAYVSDKGGFDAFARPLSLWYVEVWNAAADPYPLPAALSIDEMQENPSFSPDASKLVFVVRTSISETLRQTEIWTLDLSGDSQGETTTLVAGPEAAYDPAWSPDGANIAYIQRTGTFNDVWIAPSDGDGEPYQLTQIGTCVSPTWSPDGNFLAFFREHEGDFEAWYVELSPGADGRLTASEPRKLFEADKIDTQSGMSWRE